MQIDYLSEDLPIPGQKFCLISFVSPTGNQKCDVNGVKIRGSFDTLEEANKRASELRTIDPDFDIYVASVGKWLPWYPNPEKMPEVEYQEKELNTLVKGHKESQIKSKQHFEERKRMLMEQAIQEGTKEGQQALAEKPLHPVVVKQKLEETQNTIKELKKNIEELEEQEKDFSNIMSTFSEEDFKPVESSDVSEINKALFESENII